MKPKITPTGKEISLTDDDIIVSKTDLTGRITYANRTFMRIANYSERQLLGIQHNIVRHPDMPRGAFKLLWDTLKSGQEFFAYVFNMTSEGHGYWVFANVTPDRDANGKVIGYFSVRRKPKPAALDVVRPIYKQMLEIEKAAGAAKATDASIRFVQDTLKGLGTDYERFILSI
ncbi:MAG: PAS domain-containing protein [Chromatiales bacterium]|jgi:aerotaxis receptor|nr:PAS domain-containing protein [Chromatiales bacterium]MDX9766540.1 PAS domain-containing protein [Ectothiorhodospiraceae bacterium]